MTDEENVPAAQQEQKEDPRIPGQDEDGKRKGRDTEKAREGEKTAYGIDGRTLGRAERLHKSDFRFARWTGSGRSPHFLLFRRTNDQAVARFGVVVSRKIKGAVKRNRIKRLVREFLRLHKHLFPGAANYSVRVTKMPPGPAWGTVREELAALASKAFHG